MDRQNVSSLTQDDIETKPTIIVEILQKTIFLFSAGQPRKVEQAIAFTLRNRLLANREEFGGRNIADVCLQFWEYSRPEEVEIPEEEQIKMSTWLKRLWNGGMHDITKGALYFKLSDDKGRWTEGMEKTTTIKGIEFYKDEDED